MATFACPYCGATKNMSASRALLNRTCGAPDCRTRYLGVVGHGNQGRQHPDAQKAKISRALIGRPQTSEHVQAKTVARAIHGRWFDVEDIGARISAGYARGKAEGRLYGATGPGNPMWRGGVAAASRRGRGTDEYAQWRGAVLERDGYRCQMCGTDRLVIAHHILGWHDFARYRTDVDNGIALCRSCHAIAHGFAQHFSKS